MRPETGANAERVHEALARFERPLTRYALRLTGDLETARDVVQDTFLRLCTADQLGIENHLAPWLFTVCRNRALDVVRKEQRSTPLTDAAAAGQPSRDPAPSAVAEWHEAADRLADLLERLPANQQEVIRLKFQHGMSYKEISGVTGLSVSNVGFLLHTGIKTLRRLLGTTTDLA